MISLPAERISKGGEGAKRPFFKGALTLALLLSMALTAPLTQAHPFGDTAESHRLELKLEPDSLKLTYQREIPTPGVMMAFLTFLDGEDPTPEGDRAFTATQLAAMEREIEVFVNNERLPLAPGAEAKGDNGRGNARFFTYVLSYEGALALEPGDEAEIVVFNHVSSPEGAYYQNEVSISPELRLLEASHLGSDAEGGWSQDKRQRTLKVKVLAPKRLPPPWLIGGSLGAIAALGVGIWRWRGGRADGLASKSEEVSG